MMRQVRSTGMTLAAGSFILAGFFLTPSFAEPPSGKSSFSHLQFMCSKSVQAMHQDDFAKALELAQTVCGLYPAEPYPIYLKGVALMNLRRYDEATLAFHRASQLDPQKSEYAELMNKCLQAQSQPLAKPSFESSTLLPPPTQPAKNTTATISTSRPQPTDAISAIKAGLRGRDITVDDIDKFRKENGGSISSADNARLDDLRQKLERSAFVDLAVAQSQDYGADGIDALLVVEALEDKPVKPEFVALVKAGLRSIPADFRSKFKAAGFHVQVVADISSTMSAKELNQHPRGYPDGATYKEVGAYCESSARRLVISQATCRYPDKTICHEFGHAFDVILGGRNEKNDPELTQQKAERTKYPAISHTARFRKAYLTDLSTMPEQYKDQLSYYLQPDRAGQEELFAEMFPLLYCKQALPNSRLEILRESFPQVLFEMRSALGAYD